MAAPYKSAQKLRRDNCLSEITSNATLKATTLANLGIAGEGAQLDSVWATVDETDGTKKVKFDVGGNTAGKTLTLTSAVTLDRTVTFPNASVTLASLTGTEELTNKTVTAQVVKTGLTASGSASNDFSASTGTFKTSSGANQLTGAVTIADAASPNLTTAAGSTNTGKLTVSGKTSGSLIITTADATAQALTVSGAAQTVGAATLTIPDLANVSDTVAVLTKAQTIAGKTLTGVVSSTYAAGTASVAPINLVAGTNLTSAAAGSLEYDGTNSYMTNEVTSGRGLFGVHQYFALTGNGSAISTIANFFGATSNISLVSGGYYDIDVYLWYTNSADTNTATFTLTNSAAPTAQNIYFEMSPAAGIVAPPGTATALVGQFVADTTAAKAFNTAALGSAANYYSRFKIFLKNSTGTSLKIQATKNTAGTITPLLGSYWTCRRLPAANVGSFAA